MRTRIIQQVTDEGLASDINQMICDDEDCWLSGEWFRPWDISSHTLDVYAEWYSEWLWESIHRGESWSDAEYQEVIWLIVALAILKRNLG
jgi:hypothetical protein